MVFGKKFSDLLRVLVRKYFIWTNARLLKANILQEFYKR